MGSAVMVRCGRRENASNSDASMANQTSRFIFILPPHTYIYTIYDIQYHHDHEWGYYIYVFNTYIVLMTIDAHRGQLIAMILLGE